MRLRNTERKNYEEKGLQNSIWYQARVEKYVNHVKIDKLKVKYFFFHNSVLTFISYTISRNTDGVWDHWFTSLLIRKESDVENVPSCVSVQILGEIFLVTWSNDIVAGEWNESKFVIVVISTVIPIWNIYMRLIMRKKTVTGSIFLIWIYQPKGLGFLWVYFYRKNLTLKIRKCFIIFIRKI